MDPDAMTMLLGDAICNIEEEEEYLEACQPTLKSPYEVRTSDEDKEVGEAPSDDDEGSSSKSDSGSDSSSDSGDSKDDSNNNSVKATIVAMIDVNPLVIKMMML